MDRGTIMSAGQTRAEIAAERRLQPFPQSLPAILTRAREVMMARVRPTLRAYDLTEPQWRVLRTLGSVDEIAVTHLATLVVLLPSSLSRILRDLTERGLIQRRTSELDLRRGLLSVSDDGMVLIETIAPAAARVSAEIEALYGVERMEALRGLLMELEESLGWTEVEGDS